jgi:hypothetical protein
LNGSIEDYYQLNGMVDFLFDIGKFDEIIAKSKNNTEKEKLNDEEKLLYSFYNTNLPQTLFIFFLFNYWYYVVVQLLLVVLCRNMIVLQIIKHMIFWMKK